MTLANYSPLSWELPNGVYTRWEFDSEFAEQKFPKNFLYSSINNRETRIKLIFFSRQLIRKKLTVFMLVATAITVKKVLKAMECYYYFCCCQELLLRTEIMKGN